MELPTTNIKQSSTLNTIQSSSSSSSPSSPVKQIFYYILNSSVSFKTLCASLLVGYLLTFIDKAPLYLAVIPGRLLPPSFFLWTLITHGFIEHQLFQVILNMFIILLYCKMLEPLWGTLECIKFYFITTTIVAVETTLVLILLYMMTFKEVLIFNTLIHGLSGFIGVFTVAIKQIMPDTMLLNFGVIRIKQDDLPLVVLIISTILHLVKLIEFTFLIMLSFGLLNGWIYLRFFQVHKNGNKGDSSVTFSFARYFLLSFCDN
jgi:membrane associated rhomboid family serine protease